MKVVILAGGFGTRLSEETDIKPKPMVEIGSKPVLWHIMKTYSSFGFNEFIILLGYKGHVIKEFFSNYYLYQSDFTIDLSNNSIEVHQIQSEPWKVTLLETGLNTFTGGRIKRAKDYIGDDDFLLTYGDGLSDINIKDLINFHYDHGKLATMSAVYPPARFGSIEIDTNNSILSFKEKPRGDGGRINGGFFVLSPKAIDYIIDDTTTWEKEPLENLASDSELKAFKHDGFWQPMDTVKEKIMLNDLWNNGNAPWKIWS